MSGLRRGPIGEMTFTQAGTGASERSAQAKMRERVSVFDFLTAAQKEDVAAGTALEDVTAGIQACIDYVMEQGGRSRVYMPAGRYRITDTLHLGYGDAFSSVVVEGDGYAYRGSANYCGTTIVADFNDRQAINFQGARGSILRGVAILGKNFDWIIDHDLGGTAPTLDDTDVASWVDTSFPSSATSRYAPYAGVTIDAFSGVAPATAYPSGTYGKNFSSGVLIDDCWIGGFVVGVVNQPCNADGSGDFTKLRRCLIEVNAYAVSVGNTQSRNVGTEGCSIAYFHTAFTNCAHGKQTGKYGGVFDNTSFFRGVQLFDFDAAYAGPLTWLNCYAESLWKLGRYGTGSVTTNHPMKFVGGEFYFSGQGDDRGVPASVLDAGTPAPVDFDGTELWGFPSVILLNAPVGDVHIRNVKLRTTNTRTNTYEKLAHNFLAGGLAFPVTATKNRPASFSALSTARYNIDTGASSPETLAEVCPTKRVYPVCAWSRRASPTDQPEYSVSVPLLWDSLSKASFSGITLSGKTLTLVISPARTEATFAKKGPFPGDVIYDDDSKSVFFVRSTDVATKTVIAELQNNYKLVGAAYETVTAFSTVTGNLYFGNSRVYLPQYFLRGDTSTASAQITNAGRDDGFATWIDTEITVGDFLYVNDQVDRFFSPADVKVTARSGAGGTIDLSGNAARALTTKALGFFIRKPPANV